MRTSLLYFYLITILISGCQIFQRDKDNDNDKTVTIEEEIIEKDLEEIKAEGKLTVIFDNSTTSYFIYKGQPMGYEYELVSRFCKRHNLELEIKIITSIEESFKLLNSGKADIIAYYLTVTKERLERVDFSDALLNSEQVLIQRKPENWIDIPKSKWENAMIRNPVGLIGKEVHVRQSSSFVGRLKNLSDEIGGDIVVVEEPSTVETEGLIKKVADGEIEFTVADKDVALVNAAYYPVLDVETPVSFPQQIAWAIRKNSPQLKSELNMFIEEITNSSVHKIIYNKYFKVTRTLLERANSDLSSISGSNISEYDEIIKQWSDSIGWDWKLVASMIYQESRFNTFAASWAGAKGLMQLMPRTGNRFGATNLYDPSQNIKAGTGYIEYLDNYWRKTVSDSLERQKFILASYNSGLGHVQDAVALAQEFGYLIYKWDDEVEECMKMKSKSKYYRNKVVKYGYCRGESVVKYVEDILYRYHQYHDHFEEEDFSTQ
ncbi:MAG: transporter substrate-binding domain-containing protein [Cyclobacteriaceae bacterium]|nr:transporter substrate-binding domain-containing protein [Cyclobacteriaceae bacterium]